MEAIRCAKIFNVPSKPVEATKNERKKVVCFKCNKEGHFARNCKSAKVNVA